MTRAFVRWPRRRSLPYRDAWVLRVAINEALGELRRAGRKSAPVRLFRYDGSDVLEDLVTTRLALAAALRSCLDVNARPSSCATSLISARTIRRRLLV